ncbi:MAG: Rieske (2Fe-2S) protein [Hyphomicrobiaceae bacterium]
MTGAEGEGWQRVAARTDVQSGALLAVKHGDLPIVLVEHEGGIYALGNICPHAYALMSEGFLDGEQLECPLHGAIFDVRTGKCLGGPTDEDLPVYEVRVEGDDVFVKANE